MLVLYDVRGVKGASSNRVADDQASRSRPSRRDCFVRAVRPHRRDQGANAGQRSLQNHLASVQGSVRQRGYSGVLPSVRRHPRQLWSLLRAILCVLRAFERKERRHGALALCAGAAGAGAAFATNPLDLVKLRLQVQRASGVAKSDGLIEFDTPTGSTASRRSSAARALQRFSKAPSFASRSSPR